MTEISTFTSPAGDAIAWRNDGRPPRGEGPCGLFWLGGFMSDMEGAKASALAALAVAEGRSAVRFDYSGHGRSGGALAGGTIGKWLAEAEALFCEVAAGPRILVGSSMGGWIAMLLARRLLRRAPGEAARIRGMVLLAPAADMTEELMWKKFPPKARRELMEQGRVLAPNAYGGEPYLLTRGLIEEGRRHLLLERGLNAPFPVRILQGEEDADVPWEHGLRTFRAISGEDVAFTLIRGGDHRLSGPRELRFLRETLHGLLARADGD